MLKDSDVSFFNYATPPPPPTIPAETAEASTQKNIGILAHVNLEQRNPLLPYMLTDSDCRSLLHPKKPHRWIRLHLHSLTPKTCPVLLTHQFCSLLQIISKVQQHSDALSHQRYYLQIHYLSAHLPCPESNTGEKNENS